VNWSDICEVILFWSEVSYVEVLRDKSNMHIRVTLYWGYLILLWLFYFMSILYSGCFNLFCNICVCVCVRVCVYEFCNVWFCNVLGVLTIVRGVLVICVLVFTVFLYCFFYVYLFLFVTSVRTTATYWKLNCSK
jgi:hypothetical protein